MEFLRSYNIYICMCNKKNLIEDSDIVLSLSLVCFLLIFDMKMKISATIIFFIISAVNNDKYKLIVYYNYYLLYEFLLISFQSY